MASEIHSAALGSAVFMKILVAGCDSMTSAMMAVDDLKLGLTLEAEHKRILALAVLGDGRMELRELLQTRQLVDHKPDRLLTWLRCARAGA